MTDTNKDVEFLNDYIDWKAAQKFRDTDPATFVQEYERDRLARNAAAVLLFLDDWHEENKESYDQPDADGLHGVVHYLLNAEVGDPEVEEWFESESAPVVSIQSYTSEEGYYEDVEPF